MKTGSSNGNCSIHLENRISNGTRTRRTFVIFRISLLHLHRENCPHFMRSLESICMRYNHGVVCFIRFAACPDFCDEYHRSPRNLISYQKQNTRRASDQGSVSVERVHSVELMTEVDLRPNSQVSPRPNHSGLNKGTLEAVLCPCPPSRGLKLLSLGFNSFWTYLPVWMFE